MRGVVRHRETEDTAFAVRRGPIDPWLLLLVAMLLLVGEVMVFDTTYFYAFERFNDPYHFVWKHQVALLLGCCGLMAAMRVPSTTYRRLTYPFLLVALIGLIAVFLPGLSHGRVHRWIHLGLFNFQPSEFAKGAVVLYLAHALTKKAGLITHFIRGVAPHLVVIGIVIALIAVEPDLGGAAFVGMTLFVLLFAAGARLRQLAVLTVCAVALLLCGIFAAGYRTDRLAVFLQRVEDPQGKGYQLNQSLLAFGAGGIHGVGLGEGRQKMFYLPEAHTDFAFAVLGEETGLWGTTGVLMLFMLLGLRGLRIAVRHPQRFGRLLACGCTFLLVGQAGLNMAVVLGMLPTKGLPLPFISYGGSALIMALIYVGMLLALSREIRQEPRVYV